MPIVGLIDLTKHFNGSKWYVEQFPPGCYAVYKIGKDSRVTLVEETKYYQIGSRPKFTPWISYDCKILISFVSFSYRIKKAYKNKFCSYRKK